MFTHKAIRGMARAVCVGLWAAFAFTVQAEAEGSALSTTVDRPPAPPSPETVPPGSEGPAKPTTDEAATGATEGLSLRERVAQLMIVTLEGQSGPNSLDISFLKKDPPGGVILPTTLRPSYVAGYAAAIRKLPIEAQKGIPLIIGANLFEELKQPGTASCFSRLPSLLSIAAANDPDSTERWARLMAQYLSAMGFNLLLGPSLELAPALPEVKGSIHTLGSAPAFVAAAGATILESLAANGVTAVPVGFPGGGGYRLPKLPPVLETPRADLTRLDLLPYARAIEKGARMIHVGNVRVPTLELDQRPASLSKAVMGDLLRRQLGFDGVIVVGPLDAPEVSVLVDPSQAAVQALQSGADMILWSSAGVRVDKAIDRILAAVDAGVLGPDRIDAAYARVLAFKHGQNLNTRPLPDVREAEKVEKDRSYTKAAYEIERRSITLIKNANNALPLSKDASMPIGITGTVGVKELGQALEKHIKHISTQPILTAKHMGDIGDFEIARLTTRLHLRTVICVLTNMPKTQGQIELIQALKAKGVRVVVVFLGYPSGVSVVAGADAILLDYSEGAVLSESMKAIAEALVGKSALGILPAVRDLNTKPGQVEIYNVLDVVRTPAGVLPLTLQDPFVAGCAVSYDPSLTLGKAEWDFGDGARAKGLQVKHAFETQGSFPITLTVKDRQGYLTTGTFHAQVN